uniref:RRP15-like protein n=1 Tax=Chromera velia CCMP2878 TaxID=1169474 RepID=A0A0G4H4Y9_9ALVE|eukprot:Cvel_24693.t1-p1 / transcript=Cvel_24693.t1 / gene=Cvel_24693 / organism=Chromera_velia_CCMP2878 / gene_product=hypothetical protein / transcript_product=hypothetical protein / location=Cvel_scaffold2706:12521-16136(+) / protein_length=389 / sequence_SO=supercontig / SO=protein_coding / is_pseudo=false
MKKGKVKGGSAGGEKTKTKRGLATSSSSSVSKATAPQKKKAKKPPLPPPATFLEDALVNPKVRESDESGGSDDDQEEERALMRRKDLPGDGSDEDEDEEEEEEDEEDEDGGEMEADSDENNADLRIEKEEDELAAQADTSAKGFATAFRTIMSRPGQGDAAQGAGAASASGAQPAMLAEKGEIFESLAREKEDAKLRKQLAAEKKRLWNSAHVLPDILKKSQEKELKKVATRGVVKLFNTVMEFRRRMLDSEAGKALSSATAGAGKGKGAGAKKGKRDEKVKDFVVEVDEQAQKGFMSILEKKENQKGGSTKKKKHTDDDHDHQEVDTQIKRVKQEKAPQPRRFVVKTEDGDGDGGSPTGRKGHEKVKKEGSFQKKGKPAKAVGGKAKR